jgi:tetratricopeptide (TPR) repeat protein
MSDPLSTSPARASEPADQADREARIEQLLLSGLDHYFAGHYERAISVWTRVVFLDRHHDRAHAYIERARSAVAERQRKSEELLHDGVSAYNAGEVDKARELLTRAVEQGSDAADVFLGRLNRVGTGAGIDLRLNPLPAPSMMRRRLVPRVAHRTGRTAVVVIAIVVAATMLLGGLPIGSWLSEWQGGPPASANSLIPDEPLPVVRPSETALVRARSLYAGGHLRDALKALDRVGLADPLRNQADQLRADIQRDLLAAAGLASAPSTSSGNNP